MLNRSRLLVLRTSATTVRALAPFPHRHLQSFRAVAAAVPVMSSGLKTKIPWKLKILETNNISCREKTPLPKEQKKNELCWKGGLVSCFFKNFWGSECFWSCRSFLQAARKTHRHWVFSFHGLETGTLGAAKVLISFSNSSWRNWSELARVRGEWNWAVQKP